MYVPSDLNIRDQEDIKDNEMKQRKKDMIYYYLSSKNLLILNHVGYYRNNKRQHMSNAFTAN